MSRHAPAAQLGIAIASKIKIEFSGHDSGHSFDACDEA
jgi:hypothetical protein